MRKGVFFIAHEEENNVVVLRKQQCFALFLSRPSLIGTESIEIQFFDFANRSTTVQRFANVSDVRLQLYRTFRGVRGNHLFTVIRDSGEKWKSSKRKLLESAYSKKKGSRKEKKMEKRRAKIHVLLLRVRFSRRETRYSDENKQTARAHVQSVRQIFALRFRDHTASR